MFAARDKYQNDIFGRPTPGASANLPSIGFIGNEDAGVIEFQHGLSNELRGKVDYEYVKLKPKKLNQNQNVSDALDANQGAIYGYVVQKPNTNPMEEITVATGLDYTNNRVM